MLVALSLFFLLLRTSPSQAHRTCYHVLDERTRLHAPGPSYLDCRHALLQLPGPRDDASDSFSNTSSASGDVSPLVSPTHPFFPFSDVYHDTCMLVLRFYEGRVPLSLNAIERGEHEGLPQQSLTEESVLKLWNAYREAGRQVLTDCVDRSLAGVQWEPIDLPDMPFAWYGALLTAVPSLVWEERREQRIALSGLFDGDPFWRRAWNFNVGIYDA